MKLTVQEIADPSRLEIESNRLGLESERLRLETERNAKGGPLRSLSRNMAGVIATVVPFAALCLTGGQVWIAQINKQRETALLQAQQQRETALLQAQQQQEWSYKALDFVARHADVFSGSDPQKATQLAAVITVGFPNPVADSILVNLEITSPTVIAEAIHKFRFGVREAIEKKIIDIVVERTGIDPRKISPDATLGSLIGFDELDWITLQIHLEHEFALEIHDYKITIADLAERISQRTPGPSYPFRKSSRQPVSSVTPPASTPAHSPVPAPTR